MIARDDCIEKRNIFSKPTKDYLLCTAPDAFISAMYIHALIDQTLIFNVLLQVNTSKNGLAMLTCKHIVNTYHIAYPNYYGELWDDTSKAHDKDAQFFLSVLLQT